MTISVSKLNRPFKYGPSDRREFIVQDTEVALRIEYDANDNPIYVGRAKIGSSTSDDVWQIQSLSYDANDNLISVKWPQNASSNASGEYSFVWDNRGAYTYA